MNRIILHEKDRVVYINGLKLVDVTDSHVGSLLIIEGTDPQEVYHDPNSRFFSRMDEADLMSLNPSKVKYRKRWFGRPKAYLPGGYYWDGTPPCLRRFEFSSYVLERK